MPDQNLEGRLRRLAEQISQETTRQRSRKSVQSQAMYKPKNKFSLKLALGALAFIGGISLINYLNNYYQVPHPMEVSVARQRLKEGNPSSHFDLAMALHAAGNLEEAAKQYNKVIEINPNDIEAYANLGSVLKDKGDIDGAIRQYNIALNLDKNNASIHNNLGIALRSKGSIDEAINEYKIAIALDPGNVRAYNNLGVALEEKGNTEEAIKVYIKSISVYKNNTVAMGNLGALLCKNGDFTSGINWLKKVIESDPLDAIAHYNLGNALFDSGNLEEAITNYKKTLELNPKISEAQHNLNIALKKIEETRELERKLNQYRTEFEKIKQETNVHLWHDATLDRKETTILLDDNEISNKIYTLLNKLSDEKDNKSFEPLKEEVKNFEYFNIGIESELNVGSLLVTIGRLGMERVKFNKKITEVYKYRPYTRQKTVLSGYQKFIGAEPLWINGVNHPNLQDFFQSHNVGY